MAHSHRIAFCFWLLAGASMLSLPRPGRADIYQWEWINPADHSLGKQQSTTVCPGGAGVSAAPAAVLDGRNLYQAYLIGAELSGASAIHTGLRLADLTNADLTQANLGMAFFWDATLTGANFTDAEVRGATFGRNGVGSSNLTAAQLYSTASYKAKDLTAIELEGIDLGGCNFAGQNLTRADFAGATLSNANFTDAEIRRASFMDATSHGFTAAQLYSTASFKAKDLSGVDLSANDLSGWDFAGQKLTNVNFAGGILTAADFTQANLRSADLSQVASLTGANFTDAEVGGAKLGGGASKGFTAAQLYSTSSYKAEDLTGVGLGGIDLSGCNFAGQNLTNAAFGGATLTSANFTQANLTGANFYSYPLSAQLMNANFTDAEVRGAKFGGYHSSSNLTDGQLYSTASYKAKDLRGIHLDGIDLSGWNFAGQNLTDASFGGSAGITTLLTNANFTDAEIAGAYFGLSNFTPAQLYSTASYKAKDLTGINLDFNDVSGWNFAGQNLTHGRFQDATMKNANFTQANLRGAVMGRDVTNADFTDAEVRGAGFGAYGSYLPGPLTAAQLYSTASYKAKDLSGIALGGIDLSGWNFAGQNLTHADFFAATLTSANFTGAEVRGARFNLYGHEGLTSAQLYSTASYKAKNLTGIDLGGIDLSGWDFAGRNLTNANFAGATLTSADLTDAEVRGADFRLTTFRGFTSAHLYSTASYKAKDLSGMDLSANDLSGWNFAGQNLTGAWFGHHGQGDATLTNANFTDAEVRGTHFYQAGSFTAGQLYSTASYKAKNLSGIDLGDNDLIGWDFAGQDLTGADFYFASLVDANFNSATLSNATLTNARFFGATVANADFSGADTRGAQGLDLAGAIATNTIRPDGSIQGLDLSGGRMLLVRAYQRDYFQAPAIPITVQERMSMDATSALRMVLRVEQPWPWASTVSFAPGIPVTLAGTLQLTFAQGVDGRWLVGGSVPLFDWWGVSPTGTFNVQSAYQWDLTRLYSSGEVTLIAVPAPAWNPSVGGSYNDWLNWTEDTVPNGVDAAAYFLTTITMPSTVTVDLPVTVGAVTFDSALSYTIEGPAPLTMATSAGQPRITVLQGDHTISAPLQFASGLIVDTAAASSLTVNLPSPGVITADLTKQGPGTWVLSGGLALLGQVHVDEGTLIVGLKDADKAQLYGAQLAGGTLSSFNGIEVQPFDFQAGTAVQGYGTINGNVTLSQPGEGLAVVAGTSSSQPIVMTGTVNGSATMINVIRTGLYKPGFRPVFLPETPVNGEPYGMNTVVQLLGPTGGQIIGEPGLANPNGAQGLVVGDYTQLYLSMDPQATSVPVKGPFLIYTFDPNNPSDTYTPKAGDVFQLLVTGPYDASFLGGVKPAAVLSYEDPTGVSLFNFDHAQLRPGLEWQWDVSPNGLTLMVVPEPGTLVLLLTGAFGVLLLVRRRKRQR